jgi:Ca2+-binding RTX toxin-like protein
MAKIITNGGKSGKIEGTNKSDVIEGRGGDDKIGGHKGADQIDGGTGDDRMHGGGGIDTLTGGSGVDWFVFKEAGISAYDFITDFTRGSDKIRFELSVFTALDADGVAKSEFVLGTSAKDGDDHLIYDRGSGNLYYDDDGNGAHQQQWVATLENHAKLTHTDFLTFFD